MMRLSILILIGLLLIPAPGLAQDNQDNNVDTPVDVVHHTVEVFLERSVDEQGRDRLILSDVLTGESVETLVYGERYTPAGNEILYFDTVRGQVMTLRADGNPRPHPFMQLEDNARRIDWVVSADGRYLAWTLTYGSGDAMTTITSIATLDGANRRVILEDGPRPVRALPVSFSLDGEALYMDAHPDGLSPYMAYIQYAGLFRVDLDDGTISSLPGEPACFCGAAIRAGQYLRLMLVDGGYDMRVYDLMGDSSQTIDAIRLNNFTRAGDILIAPDGTLAIYALSQIEDFGTVNQSIRTVFILVDLVNLTQRALTDPITTYVHPVRWTEDNTAVLFTSPQVNGTWKIDLRDGQLYKVAQAAYLGTLSD